MPWPAVVEAAALRRAAIAAPLAASRPATLASRRAMPASRPATLARRPTPAVSRPAAIARNHAAIADIRAATSTRTAASRLAADAGRPATPVMPARPPLAWQVRPPRRKRPRLATRPKPTELGPKRTRDTIERRRSLALRACGGMPRWFRRRGVARDPNVRPNNRPPEPPSSRRRQASLWRTFLNRRRAECPTPRASF